jgi:hypothetical protein
MRFYEGEPEFVKYGARISPIRIADESVTLNLKNPIDRRRLEVAKELRDLGKFPFDPSDPLIEIVEPETEDLEAAAKFDREYEAMRIFKEELSNPDDLRQFAHYFGLGDGKDATVKRNMLEMVKASPNQFIEGWQDSFRHLMILTRRAIDKGLISLRADTNIYFFGDKVLGVNYAEVVATLAGDSQLVAVLNSKL